VLFKRSINQFYCRHATNSAAIQNTSVESSRHGWRTNAKHRIYNCRDLRGPHRSTTYADAVYCYRQSSVVCLSVGRSVTLVSPAKAAEPIEMPFGLSDGPKESCIRWGDIPMRRGNY